MLDISLRLATILVFILWRINWWITEKKADKEKPKLRSKDRFFSRQNVERYGAWVFYFIVFLQLIGLHLFPMQSNEQLFGFLCVLVGFFVLIIARRELSTNWAKASEHQIKEKHTLITTGIYAYIRHPIYIGIVLCMFGAELVSQSYLFLISIIWLYGAYTQGKREEKILLTHFGKQYADYMKRTKMFIPFVL